MARLSRAEQAARTAEMVRLRLAGAPYASIAAMFGVSEKCVQRSLKSSGQLDKPASYYRLKPKERKLVDGRAQGLSRREAALAAGYSASTARSGVRETVGVSLALAEVVRAAAPAEYVARRVREGIDATETRFFAEKGRVREERVLPDMGTRHRYIELYAKVTGALRDAVDVTVPVQVVLDL